MTRIVISILFLLLTDNIFSQTSQTIVSDTNQFFYSNHYPAEMLDWANDSLNRFGTCCESKIVHDSLLVNYSYHNTIIYDYNKKILAQIFRVSDNKSYPFIEIKYNNKIYSEKDPNFYEKTLEIPIFELRGLQSDYFELKFNLIKTIDKYYMVLINFNGHDTTAFIEKTDTLFEKMSIDEYVKLNTVLGFNINRNKNPILKEPNDSSIIIHNTKEEQYKIWVCNKLLQRGDWMYIETPLKERGWVRWRKGNKIVIEMCYGF